ncbi:hypothetical protein [Aestuariimicrobium sp. T2.26MG-19.2B]|uniref:hypothetical protein n=1 Tax=Aestuariimicrobium sp. T2.26MG-19.2B TaxID=3040679 RepID=UPI0024774F93|nr:hypothetical protein [Aestuariimicrobium sp. T2.26MG-19.2B]CAI9408308.1 hypothetical protein AESSP_02002 [Aestuariimicrobium sp. T2.26MG-19.2B]
MSLRRPISWGPTPARSARAWFAAAVAGLVPLLVAVLLSTWSATTAWACSCVEEDLNHQVTRADAIFRGVVERVRVPTGNQMAGNVLTVRPTQVWKGEARGRLEVIDGYGQGGGACGQDFAVGADVLFMVQRTGEGWQGGLCSGTASHSASRASDITELLGAGTEISITPLPPAASETLVWPGIVGGVLAFGCVTVVIAIVRRRHRRAGA